MQCQKRTYCKQKGTVVHFSLEIPLKLIGILSFLAGTKMPGDRDGIQELRVSEAVTSLNEQSIVMVTEIDEHCEPLDEEEVADLVPTTATAFINIEGEGQPSTSDNVSMCGYIGERTVTVGEQLPDIIQPANSVNDDIPSAGCEGLRKKART
ncbi:uncharacterized protein LOC123530681 isoform X2 [Mercenaria mercenaria]|uniref:uncharacterized protein LOC123530681 isoform X2 n=1 Tax=Mercenaria mercenaria TaxID=6596 RepID=UPI00234EA09E|nr:uncharacterized protein LOC123530681 isoform X2 [Mercenaria mercenaria]